MCRQTVLLRGQDYEAGRIVALIHVLYIMLEHVIFNIMFSIKSDVITLDGFGDIDCIYMDKWAYVAIFTRMWTRCGRCIILHRLYFG